MAKHNYSTKTDQHMARAVLRAAPISHKQSIEIANHIRGRSVADCKKILAKAIALEAPIPLKRFVADRGHKPGMGPGRYAVKASQMILQIIESAEANAQFKGLETSRLILSHIVTNKASRPYRMGRQRGRKGKRTNVEIVLIEAESKKGKKAAKEAKTEDNEIKAEAKTEAKAEKKPAVKKTAKKEDNK